MTKLNTRNSIQSLLIAAITSSAFLMSACGGGSEVASDSVGGGTGTGGTGGAGGTGGGNITGSGLACDVLSPAFIQTTFAETLPVQNAQLDGSFRRATSGCEWTKPDGIDSTTEFYNVELALYGPGKIDLQVGAFGGTEVAGLGDRAVFVKSSVNALYVAQGDVEMEIFMQKTPGAGVTEQQELDQMKLVAAEGLKNL